MHDADVATGRQPVSDALLCETRVDDLVVGVDGVVGDLAVDNEVAILVLIELGDWQTDERLGV
jgi:hypothetical protein